MSFRRIFSAFRAKLGVALSDAIDGLRASRPDGQANVTAIGHSYGSVVVAKAASGDGLDVDQIVVAGSPGLGEGVDRASDLGVGAENVYVARNSQDFIANLGDKGYVNKGVVRGEGVGLEGAAGLGRDPSEDRFGARRFEAEDPTRNLWGTRNMAQHTNYFNPNTESLYNIGRIVDGKSSAVNEAESVNDPWWRGHQDPEQRRMVSEPGVPDRSTTDPDKLK